MLFLMIFVGCSSKKKIDLVFVIDQSNSLSSDDFQRSQMFVKNIVDDFHISFATTRVAVVTYSSNATTRFHLNDHGDKSSVNTAIDNMPFNSGTTATADALNKVLMDVFQVCS